MAKLEPIAKASSLRSPEREQLAAAIETHKKAIDRLARINAASEGTFVWTAQEAVEQAEAALAQAREREPRLLVAQLIGDVGFSSNTVEHAQFALEAAQDNLTRAQRARTALEEQQRQAEREVERAAYSVKSAVSRVVGAEGGADKVLAQFEDARREVARLHEILSFLSARNCLPPYWDSVRTTPPTLADEPWRQAFAVLEADADAPLPQ